MRTKKTANLFGWVLGQMLIAAFVLNVPAQAQEGVKNWTGEVFAGYNQSNGNTKKGAGNINAEAVRKFTDSEFKLKGNFSYGETNSQMDTQKWDALAKFSRDIGSEKKWFNFYQLTADHDYFADIDYRLTPGAGFGYHISQEEDWTWDVDAGLGYRITRYRTNTAADDEVVSVLGHTFMKKKIFENAFLSEDFTVVPGLESGAGVVLRSETAFTNPISRNMDFQVKYIIDHNSEPAAGKKKTDTQIVTGIKYKF